MAPSIWVTEMQRPFLWLAVDNERRDGRLPVWPAGASESLSLPGVDVDTVGELVYVAVGYTPPVAPMAAGEPPTEAALEIAWAREGRTGVQRRTIATREGDLAGRPMTIGGSGRDRFGHEMTRGGLEVLHLAVHDEVFNAAEVARRLRAIGLEP